MAILNVLLELIIFRASFVMEHYQKNSVPVDIIGYF